MAKKKTIKKPKPHKTEYYYWYEITDYIQRKYNRSIRDWAGRFAKAGNPSAPYQDFWHSIINKFSIIEHNDETWEVFWEEHRGKAEKWEEEIIDILIKEGFDGVEINFSW